jgi:hypothetical protein
MNAAGIATRRGNDSRKRFEMAEQGPIAEANGASWFRVIAL